MLIKKMFNNNALLAEDSQKNEMILMGKGIAFKKKIGDLVEANLIEKKFVFDASKLNKKFEQLFDEIPLQYVELSANIIEMAQGEFENEFDPNIFIALTDHIAYAIRRYQNNQKLKNILLWEIKKFHPKEFELGLKALEIIYYETKMSMDEDEAGYIAMHIVNAQQEGEEIEQTIKVTRMVDNILHIVEYHFQISLDEQSLNYTRFVTHIRFFARRLFSNEINCYTDSILYEQVSSRYPEAYQCALKIKRYIEEYCNIKLTMDEMVYFILHINRVCNRKVNN